MPKTPAIGSPAPDFTLSGVRLVENEMTRSTFTLSGEAGHPVLLVFYPGDETRVCTEQLCSYNNELAQFTQLGCTVWGISLQDLDSHERFARKEKLTFPLLEGTSDVISSYGIGMPGLGLRRSVFLVDAHGVLRWKHVALIGATFQNVDTLRRQIELLGV
ncbi:redoxin domain-containing protein [Agreia sp. COWG]|uniref:peroxiredoxin family protein n=1 Tax=Agreia sp. COWG TaxID=2773266 RepID=UPI001925F6C4|nr:redoxin domain-containing protein [Agreia sp. COWG]CAD6001895.1 Peroxiredoxin [Agreia sp. COWG]